MGKEKEVLTDKLLYEIELSIRSTLSESDFNGVEYDIAKDQIKLDKEKFQDIMDVFYPGRYHVEETEENEDYIFVSLVLFNILKLRFSR